MRRIVCPESSEPSRTLDRRLFTNWNSLDSALLGYIEGGGILFRGPKAAMRLHRSGFTVYNEIPRYSENYQPDSVAMEVKSKADGTLDHMRNFLDCIKSRATPNAPVEVGVAAARAGHVANLALRGTGVWNRDAG